MRIKIHKVFVLLFCLSNTVCFSQKQQTQDKKLAKANAEYENFSFVKAGKLYEQLVSKGYDSKEIYARLGDTYFFNADYYSALQWYTKMMEDVASAPSEYYHRYSVCLRANDQHEEGLAVMSAYYKKIGKADEAKKWDPATYLKEIAAQSNRYDNLMQARTNSPFSDFGAALVPNEEAIRYNKDLVQAERSEKDRMIRENAEKRRSDDGNKLGATGEFLIQDKNNGQEKFIISEKEIASNKDYNQIVALENLPKYKDVIYATAKDSGFFNRKHNWSEKSFLKLYTAQIDEEGNLHNEKKLSGDVNSKYHQSTPVITNDGLTMYFTRLVVYDKIKNKTNNKKAISNLKIFQAQKINNKWGNVKELPYPINVEGTSSAHPALSANNDELFFVSNRKKKMNDTDLYVVNRKKGGGFANKADSLGEEVNTYGRETFPFVDDSGVLYFSSDGHPGLGGLDTFAAVKDGNGKYVVVNVGEPVNSTSDDFAYSIDSDSKKGFFSSNRKGGAGEDDLYTFLETKSIEFPFNLKPIYFGTVKDSISGQLLHQVEVSVFNDLKEKIKKIYSDESGKFSVDLEPLKNYTFEFKKKGYTTEKIIVKGIKIGEKKEIQAVLFNELEVVVGNQVLTLKEGDNLTEKLKLNPIYFDYGGYTLRKSSKLELNKVINLLKTRPSISILVKSHTDSRGKDDFNMRLSKNRAKTTVDYIVLEGGIDQDRVWGDGYGESQLINKCSNDVKCTEAEHELNRRSEFIIVIKEQNE
ncbi:OmpA family protein [Flavobacterium sp. 2]|uniref:OmpA family protein n=1 Tax=Flavobacterium sp. 2 TaxID=308053 RepID=UPI000C18C55A|nr:OmpA family protein [Flavobacterium sp. 2]PIF71099.1 outer membrane protein OmpA-like peptidoglycan-associated protein [Flavobacterium sp. 2]